MKQSSLTKLFDPEKVILVGASERKLFSAGIARYLLAHGFGERLTMVNRRGGQVFGHAAYADITTAATDGPFDLAILAIPAPAVPATIDELGKIGCRLAVVEAAGFAETGEQGAALQRELLQKARQHGVRVLGPNCIGVIDTRTRFATTEVVEETLQPGGVGLIAQSGVFGAILLDWAPSHGLRLSKAITLGNRVDLDEADFLRLLADDDSTRVAALYMEGVADGRKFLSAVEFCSKKKPVVVLKGGRTESGAKAVGSHTASLAGSDAVFAGALKQAGGIRAHSLQHLIDVVRAFDACPLPSGPRVAMITTSGSQGILATDTIVEAGLELAELSAQTIAALKKLAPPWMTLGNPLDLGPSGIYHEGIKALLADPGVDALLLHIAIPWGAMNQMIQAGTTAELLLGDLAELRQAARRMPILVSHVGYPRFMELVKDAVGDFLPIYPTAERAAAALATITQFKKAR